MGADDAVARERAERQGVSPYVRAVEDTLARSARPAAPGSGEVPADTQAALSRAGLSSRTLVLLAHAAERDAERLEERSHHVPPLTRDLFRADAALLRSTVRPLTGAALHVSAQEPDRPALSSHCVNHLDPRQDCAWCVSASADLDRATGTRS